MHATAHVVDRVRRLYQVLAAANSLCTCKPELASRRTEPVHEVTGLLCTRHRRREHRVMSCQCVPFHTNKHNLVASSDSNRGKAWQCCCRVVHRCQYNMLASILVSIELAPRHTAERVLYLLASAPSTTPNNWNCCHSCGQANIA